MKKSIKLISLLLIAVLVTSCSSKETGNGADDKLTVIGTVFPQFDFARQIGKDRVKCEMLIRPGADSHSYTGDDPSDILRIMNCDLFIYVGGETDSEWVLRIKDLIEKSDEKCPVFLSLMEVCDVIEESGGGIAETAWEDEEEPEYDEHVWTSPKNASNAVSAICNAMCELDPDNKDFYRSNCKEYLDELNDIDIGFKDLFDDSASKTLVFADRFPFGYFAEEYGLECYAAFSGCSSQSEPAPTTIASLCNIVNNKSLPYVFYIETSQSDVPDAIVKHTGCRKMLLHSCHTVTQQELDEGETYLSLMKQNLYNLREAFGNE